MNFLELKYLIFVSPLSNSVLQFKTHENVLCENNFTKISLLSICLPSKFFVKTVAPMEMNFGGYMQTGQLNSLDHEKPLYKGGQRAV